MSMLQLVIAQLVQESGDGNDVVVGDGYGDDDAVVGDGNDDVVGDGDGVDQRSRPPCSS